MGLNCFWGHCRWGIPGTPRSLHLLEQEAASCWYNIKTMKLKLSPNQKPAIYYFECENQQTIFQ